MRMDLVVPFTVELVPLQADLGEFLVVDLGSGWVGPVIELGVHFQAFGCGRGGDEIDNDLEADERFAAPVLANEAEQPMLDFVPLAGAGWEVTDRDAQAGFVGQFLQLHFPQAQTRSVASPGIRRDQ